MRRLEVLGVTEYHGGADNKCTILDGMRKRMSLEWQEIAYLGDEWVDLAPMSRVGLPAAVANAMPDVKNWRSSATQKADAAQVGIYVAADLPRETRM